ncbi:hypothetical protein DPMN_182320, partial [Dreissena polymorpha]
KNRPVPLRPCFSNGPQPLSYFGKGIPKINVPTMFHDDWNTVVTSTALLRKTSHALAAIFFNRLKNARLLVNVDDARTATHDAQWTKSDHKSSP